MGSGGVEESGGDVCGGGLVWVGEWLIEGFARLAWGAD